MNVDLKQQLYEMGEQAKKASSILNTSSSVQKNSFFDFAILEIKTSSSFILEANAQEIAQAQKNGKDDAFIDRLTLNRERLAAMCSKLKEIKQDSDYEVELADHGEELPDEGEYVCQLYSSEKGQFFDGVIETVGDFDVKKLKFMINEYPNGEDVIDGVEYDGVDVENNGGDSNGKGYSAHVWKNVP